MSELHADSIVKSYRDNRVLTDVFISCKTGDIIGLLGRNGSGKSTLLKAMFGSIPADNKFVKVDGRVIKNISDSRNEINYLAQDSFLPDHIKVSKIIAMLCNPENVKILSNHQLIATMLHKKCKQLSGGEMRFLEILLILYSNSKFSFLDEPFNGVAPIYKGEIKQIIKIQSRHKGIMITDHDYRNVLDVATKIVLITDGGTRLANNKEELIRWGYVPDRV